MINSYTATHQQGTTASKNLFNYIVYNRQMNYYLIGQCYCLVMTKIFSGTGTVWFMIIAS